MARGGPASPTAKGPPASPARTLLVLGILLIVALSSFTLAPWAPTSPARTPVRGPAVSLADRSVTGAIGSLAAGGGPASGSPMDCEALSTSGATCGPVALGPSTPYATWLNVSSKTTGAPPGRALASLTYDAADGYVLLFSGTNLSQTTTAPAIGDTWTYQNGIWTNITANQTTAPAARYAAAMTYDAADGYVLLFGGIRYSTATYFGDTWTFSKGHWTNITSSAGTAPTPRWRANIAYDAADGYVLLFGGTPSNGTPASDTWKFKGGSWTQLNPSGSPPPLFRTSMVYDAHDQEVVLFGGCDAAVNQFGSCPGNSTWVYSNLVWSNVTSSAGPNDRGYEFMAYDPAYDGVLVFGGNPDLSLNSGSTGYPMANDTWLFSGGNWTNITTQTSGAPSRRAYGEMVWDPDGGYVLLFGGWTDAANAAMLDETWTFGPSFDAWLQPKPIRLDVGESTNLTTVVVPSSTGLTVFYSGLPAGCSNSNTLRLGCTPTSTGTFLSGVQVTNSAGASYGSNATLFVDSQPSLTAIHVSSAVVGAHIPARLNVTPSGGTPPYELNWSSLPTGCSGSNASAIECTPSRPGTFYVKVGLTDAGEGNASSSLALVVNSSYVLGFNESGLPSRTSWSVKVGGTTLSGSSASLSLNATNGTLSYQITPIPGYTTSSYSGQVLVNGRAAYLAVKFVEFTYGVTFRTVNLPVGTNWSVNVSGTVHSSTTSTVVVPEANGSYTYVPSAQTGYVTPASGNFTINGAGRTVNLTYDRAYAVTFSESGLPSGTVWNVTLAGNFSGTNTSSIGFLETNGSYSYRIGAVPGYSTTWSGSVKVSGSASTVNVTFIEVTYLVTFSEKGLPTATNWTVSIDGSATSEVTAAISVELPNGTFAYAITPIAGYTTQWGGTVTVDAAAVEVNVSFQQVTYTIAFSESGLPTGTEWGVTLANGTKSTPLPEVDFAEPNGTGYAYRIEAVPGYRTVWEGTVSVTGADVSIPVPFTRTTYTIAFNMTGLPTGTNWTVTISGNRLETDLASLPFTEPNGSYAYRIGGVPGFTVPAWTGTVVVDGANRSVPVPFNRTLYALTFVETGLTAGTRWSITIDGSMTLDSTTTSITLHLANGTYSYALAGLASYTEHPRAGSLSIDAANRSVALAFVAQYSVTFTERGLPSGTNWSVEINGTWINSTAGSLTFVGPAGGYTDRVGPIPGYLTNWTGSVNLIDANVTVNLTFTLATYLVEFSDPGVASGTTWSVTLSGPNGTMTQSSAGSGPIVFQVANGSYRYSISAPGYRTANGTTAITGPPGGPVAVVLQSLARAPSSGGGFGLAFYALIVAALAAAVLVALGVMRRRRREVPSEEPAAPEPGAEEVAPADEEPLPETEPEEPVGEPTEPPAPEPEPPEPPSEEPAVSGPEWESG